MCAWLAPLCAAQQTAKVTLDVSPTLFSVLAGINACGYDQDLNASDAIRIEIRREINANIQKSEEAQAARQDLCSFYQEHQQADASRTLSQYVSLALSLGEPPDFTPNVK